MDFKFNLPHKTRVMVWINEENRQRVLDDQPVLVDHVLSCLQQGLKDKKKLDVKELNIYNPKNPNAFSLLKRYRLHYKAVYFNWCVFYSRRS